MILNKNFKATPINSRNNNLRKIPQRNVTLDLRKSKSAGGLIATVFGATGYTGRYIVNRLASSGAQVIVPFRGEERSYNHLKLAGEVGQIVPLRFTIKDTEQIDKAVARSNIVINLIGSYWDTRNYTMEEVNAKTIERIAEACKKYGIERVIHFSTVNADINSPSKFAATKAQGEALFRKILPQGTIVRPTWIFGGEGDRLFITFGRMLSNIIPFFYYNEERTFQPVYVKDVASAVIAILGDGATFGKTFELGGPHTLSYGDFGDYVLEQIKRSDREIITFPKQWEWVRNALVSVHEKTRYPYVTRDMMKFLSTDLCVSPTALDFSYFNIKPTSILEAPIAPLASFYPPIDRTAATSYQY